MSEPIDLMAALKEAIVNEPTKEVSADKLDKVRDGVRRQAETEADIVEAKKNLADLERGLNNIRFNELPGLFELAGVDVIGLGLVTAKLEPYYRANISAEWPEERRGAAFAKLDELGASALVKVLVTVEFGQGDVEKFKALEAYLEDNQVAYSSRLGVPWQSLTAFVKEQVEAGNAKVLGALDVIGATVGKIVRVKEKKV